MACQQCGRPPIYTIGEITLCLNCADRLQSIQDRQFLQAAAMINQSLDDMDAVVGFSAGGGRIPIHAIAQGIRRGAVLNNIHIANSQVGAVNTGDYVRIDAAITMMRGSDAEEAGTIIRALAEGVANTRGLDPKHKEELVDLIDALSDEIVKRRKPSVVRSLFRSLKENVQDIAALSGIAEALGAALEKILG